MANKEWLDRGVDGLSFGERLGDLIANKGINQAELSKSTGINQSRLSDYITGKEIDHEKGIREYSAPSCANLIALAKYFDVSTDYLLGLVAIPAADLTTRDIHHKTGLTKENIASLMNRGPFGQDNIPYFVAGYEKLTNDLLNYASTHHASRTYSRFLKYATATDSPRPLPNIDSNHSVIQLKVVAEVLSGIPEEGVDYAKGFLPISEWEYSKLLLDDFLHDLKTYLRNLYFDSDAGGTDNGND